MEAGRSLGVIGEMILSERGLEDEENTEKEGGFNSHHEKGKLAHPGGHC